MSGARASGAMTDGKGNAGRNGTLRVAAIGDLHVKEDGSSSFRELFAEISRDADALVLTGDLTDLGNHDYECGCVDEVTRILKQAGVRLLDGQATEVEGVGFVGVKGFVGGFGRRMLGSFGEPTIKAMVSESMSEAMRLENAMRQVRTPRAVVVLHYAPIVETVEGEPLEIFPFLGSSRLAETIDRFPVDAIVHGHAHRGRYEGRTPRGAPVYNVAYGIQKPSGKPYALLDI